MPDAPRRGPGRRGPLAGSCSARPWLPGASPRRCATCCFAPRSAAWTAGGCASWACSAAATTGWRPARSSTRYAARFYFAPVPAYDYAEIVRIAAALLSREETRQRERGAYDVVFVDEYQDSDPAQESLLLALAGDGRELIAVGDPDQSIYAFRGADVRALTEFPERFRTAAGKTAPVVALRTCRRSGPVLLAASRRVARRLPRAPAGSASSAGHRDLIPGLGVLPARSHPPADSSTQEAALVADTLRRAHLADGVPWSSMAVLVRSAARQVPLLRRGLLPPRRSPGLRGGAGLPAARGMSPARGRCLCCSGARCARPCWTTRAPPSCSAARWWHQRPRPAPPAPVARVAGGRRGRQGPEPGDLIAGALLEPRDLIGFRDGVAGPARRVAGLLAVARDAITPAGNAEDVLWAMRAASGLAEVWQRASAAGGPAGAAADRDLDAVLALFDKAAHFTETMPPGSPGLFADSLAGQEIVGDTLAERAARDDCVRVLTAHRSKGLEWDVVVVAGVQEETWPDLRLRGSLLGADELAEAARPGEWGDGQGADVDAAMLAAKLLAEERRLFYVAATRARRRLVVTAAGGEDTDQRPSRFLTELAGDDIPIERVTGGGSHRWLSLPALVADLRRAAADTARSPAVRQAAAAQLARLAAVGVRAAHPREWYALTELSEAGPIVAGGEAVRLSPSQVESFTRCGLRWLLEAAVGAGRSDVLRHLGTVIHAAAVLAASGATEQAVADRIDEIWHHLDFGSAWYSAKQRALAERMVRRFLDWHAANPRELVAVEQAFKVRIGQVEITGKVDRLESDQDGPGGRGRPEDRRQRSPRGRARPPSAAGRVPARRPARRVRAARPRRAGRGGAGPGRQGGGRDHAGQGAAAGGPGRRRGSRLGQGPGGDRRGRDGRPGLPGPGESRLPHLPRRVLLPGPPGRRAGN